MSRLKLVQLVSLALFTTGIPAAAQTLSVYPSRRNTNAQQLARQTRSHAPESARVLAATAGSNGWQTEVAAAEAEPEAFKALLREHLRHPDRPLPNTPLGNAVRAAEVAADDQAFTGARAQMAGARHANVDAERQTLRELYNEVAAEQDDRPAVYVTADGNFRGTASGGGEGAPVGTGSLALTAITRFANMKAGLAIASTQDTVRDGFGTALLAPANGKALTSGLFDARLLAFPLHLYASASRALWQVRDTPDVRASSTTVIGFGALLYHNFADAKVQDTNLVLSGEAGVAARFMGGDIMAVDDSIRRRVLSTTSAAFIGPEVGMQITVGKMAGALQLYYMPHKRDERVPGFSGLQLVAGIGVSGDLFGGPVDRE
jgi:hypothetical protein